MERESASQSEPANVRKPRVLTDRSVIMPFAPASPSEPSKIAAGIAELRRLGWQVAERASIENDGYFAATTASRRDELLAALQGEDIDALVGTRGGYGSNYLLDDLPISAPASPKIILGFSDLTSLQIYLWQRFQWITFYGPMLAAGLDAGPGAPKGFDEKSLLAALQNTESGWTLDLHGEALHSGEAHGRVLGGCLTLVETAIGTQWDEAVASGPRFDAPETSGEIRECSWNCAGRFSRVRCSGGRQSNGTRCLPKDTRAARCPDRFWSAHRPHDASNVNGAARRERPFINDRSRRAGNS
jgi:hypothetical protein